jgi:hypothetical protein
MISVKMNSISAGPDGCLHRGEVYPLEDGEAKALVDAGYATYETAMINAPKKQTPDLEQIKKAAEVKTEPKQKPQSWGIK